MSSLPSSDRETSAPSATAPSSPADVAWRWVVGEYGDRQVPAVVATVGLGDGSLLEALDNNAPGTKVLAVEPDRVAASTVLRSPRIQAWVRSGRLTYLVGPDYSGADQAWRIFPTAVDESPILVHPASALAMGLAKAVSVLKKIVFGAVANAKARRKFAPRYLLNSLRNLPAIVAGRDITALRGTSIGIPAVVVGAGPSLDGLRSQVDNLGDRAVVIATDTALRPLLAQGIEPHLVVGLDPSETNARHLLGLSGCRRTWLVAESALDPRAVAPFAGRTFWFRVAPHHPWPWLNELGVDVGRLDVWGSVLTAAFQVAVLAGCDPIILTGADLSFPGGRPYARGTTYEFDWAWEAAMGTPVERTWRTQMAARSDLRTECDLAGNRVLTTGSMLQFRDWLVSQARKSERRVLNAGGSGMLLGDGVEQAEFSHILGTTVAPPDFRKPAGPTTARSRADLARALRTVRGRQSSGLTDKWPISGWREFSGESFDANQVGEVLSAAALQLESVRSADVSDIQSRATSAAASAALVSLHLPEATSKLRMALRGEDVTSLDAGLSVEERAERLFDSLSRLARVVSDSRAEPDFPSLPDPALIDSTAIGAIGMWSQQLRWDVLRIEAQLGAVWAAVVPPPTRSPVGTGEVLSRDSGTREQKTAIKARPHATHSLLVLAVEWLRCVASLHAQEDTRLHVAIDRLWTLEHWLRSAPESARAGSEAELSIEAALSGNLQNGTSVVIPLGVAEDALSRVLTGAVELDGGDWLVGTCRGPLNVRIAVGRRRVGLSSRPMDAEPLPVHVTPRIVSLPGNFRLKLAGYTTEGALGVVDFSTKTVLVGSNGRIRDHQVWPRPITGALSLGSLGDIAWCNSMVQGAAHSRPYLMHRPRLGADVSVIELPFRPALGVLWNGRVYFTCLPTPTLAGGVGSWAPGEDVRHEHTGLTLLSIVPTEDALALEPYARGAREGLPRRRVTNGWSWRPGERPVRRGLDALGATAAVAVSDEWTARAFPQADTIRFDSADGRHVAMRCYSPLRLAWCEDSLLVFNGDRHLLLFESILRTLA